VEKGLEVFDAGRVDGGVELLCQVPAAGRGDLQEIAADLETGYELLQNLFRKDHLP
jgi:hypothetical protein